MTKKLIKLHYVFIFIFSLSLFLRLYRIGNLTTFGRDQGIDFLVVKDMLVNHNWTLLGIKTSIGEFFQGPVYRYMLIPLFWALKLRPIAGAYTAVVVSALTITILYTTACKYLDKTTALFSSLLFAISPQFIKYGNTPLYQHFVPLFIFAALYFLFTLHKTKKTIFALLIGLSVGIASELHYLSVTFAMSILVYLCLFGKHRIKNVSSYITGLILGLSPTIAFELKHNFLNTRLFWHYLGSSSTATNHFLNTINAWVEGTGSFLGANSNILGKIIIIFIFVCSVNMRKKFSPAESVLKKLTTILLIAAATSSLFLSSIEPHYLLPLWLCFLILIPVFSQKYLSKVFSHLVLSLIVVANLIMSFSQLNINHGYYMPEGWSLKTIEVVGNTIAKDAQFHPNFNVASLIDGDTRIYPLRYVVELAGQKPGGVENYLENNSLYIVANNKDQVVGAQVWEVNSLNPSEIGDEWYISDNIKLYRLDRLK